MPHALIICLLCVISLPAAVSQRVCYLGGEGAHAVEGAYRLSDGSWLLCGWSEQLDWLPPGTPSTQLGGSTVDAILSADSGRHGFLLHVSDDLGTVLRCVSLPAGKVSNIQRIRGTEVPGAATGDLLISGRRANNGSSSSTGDGYFIARLDGNFVTAAPTALTWSHNVFCRRVDDEHEAIQPWDVRPDGSVIYAIGGAYGNEWAAVHALDPDGRPTTIEHWPTHWDASGEHHYVTASSVGAATHSGIVIKHHRSGGLRSTSEADYTAWGSTSNGQPRRGSMPDDLYYSGPVTTHERDSTGYTGYRPGRKAAGRVGQIVCDRRSGGFAIGYSYQSTLPDGNPDFEPAVVVFDADGSLRWWDRLYPDFQDSNGNGVHDSDEPRNSSPDQYVDALAIDYTRDRLVVLARCHGNNVINFYPGHEIAADADAGGFQNRFTGSNGNIHLGWLGSFGLSTGTLHASSFVGDYRGWETEEDGLGHDVLTSGKLAGWPDPNAGWPDLNTTRCVTELLVDSQGRIVIAGTSSRPFTTSDAYQSNVKPSDGQGQGGGFLRIYSGDLDEVVYATLLRSPWAAGADYDGNGGSSIGGFAADGAGAYLAVGRTDDGKPAVPTARVPAWASAAADQDSGLIALLGPDGNQPPLPGVSPSGAAVPAP